MKTKKTVLGVFDCRVYKKDTPRQARAMVAPGERVTLSCGFDENDLSEEMKPFARFHEKSGKWFIQFKVFPKNCRIYTAAARQVEFPDFERIDGGKFEVNLDFSIKHGTGTELNGCYVNAIQVIRRADNPFAPVAGASDDFTAVQPVHDDEESSDLPF